MKIYTKTGDDGTTQLFGGKRITKGHAQVDAYGTIDELNAVIGLAKAYCTDNLSNISEILSQIQNDLFIIGGQLATVDPQWKSQIPNISEEYILKLESWIDSMEASLPKLKEFILPGGCLAASYLHFSRTICRRAERVLVSAKLPEAKLYIQYLNRLSDLLFVAARFANHLNQITEIPWKKPRK